MFNGPEVSSQTIMEDMWPTSWISLQRCWQSGVNRAGARWRWYKQSKETRNCGRGLCNASTCVPIMPHGLWFLADQHTTSLSSPRLVRWALPCEPGVTHSSNHPFIHTVRRSPCPKTICTGGTRSIEMCTTCTACTTTRQPRRACMYGGSSCTARMVTGPLCCHEPFSQVRPGVTACITGAPCFCPAQRMHVLTAGVGMAVVRTPISAQNAGDRQGP
jgi:hypothetical protein